MSNADLSVSLWDKIDTFRGILSIRKAYRSHFIANRKLIHTVVVAGYGSIAALFRGKDGAVTWGREVSVRISRYSNTALSLKQHRWLSPATTGMILEKYCRKQSVPLQTVQLAHGIKVHWVGDRSAKRVMLFFHGGGYVNPAVLGHAVFLGQCLEKLQGNGEKTVLAILEYGLAPRVKYPIQYIQGAESLQYLIREGYKPSDIILGGDSAGGNLALAVISHIIHPHPNIDRIPLSEPLAGLLLICPWVTFANTAPSCQTNASKDFLVPEVTRGWADMFIDEADYNEYSVPLSANPDWWKGFPVKQTLIVSGDDELFRDDIRELSESMKEVKNLTMVNCQKEVHDACVFDAVFGLETADMAKTVFAWLGQIFS